MYSPVIEAALKKLGLKPNDRIAVSRDGQTFEGLLLPRPDVGDADALLMKLDSGYNIAVPFAGSSVLPAESAEPRVIAAEARAELGHTSKALLALAFDPAKPPISLIATGGTVASRVDYRTGGVYAVSDPREFLHNVPELAAIANVHRIERPFTKMSEDMDPSDWQALARVAAKLLNSEDRGVIITHGTDTLHYTAAALSFFLRNLSKPVVLLGSQRSADRGSSDAAVNLICAAHAALSDVAAVGICMHASMDDDRCLFIRGTKARKLHTSRRDAFRPVNELPLAKIWKTGKIDILNPLTPRRPTPVPASSVELDAAFEPRVALVKVYPGADPGVLHYHRSRGCKGFVLEATALGHVPTAAARNPWIPEIAALIRDGIPVVVATQSLYGRVHPSVYTNLRLLFHGARAIPAGDMLPETAYIKLGWVLGHTTDLEEVRKMLATNYAGEHNPRIEPETFLY